ncbi:MAG: hypothetical protein JNK72_02875 [Myxococcales bacterium]|nr:hypothetical protein [Myxococcales bacterium]
MTLLNESRRLGPKVRRLAAFVCCASLIGSVVSVRAARAQVNEGMRHLARQLMPYAENAVMETPRRVQLNGQTLLLSVGTTHDSVGAVLDWYERRCAARSGHLSEGMRQAIQTHASPLELASFNAMWANSGRRTQALEVLREGNDEEGYLACVDTGSEAALGVDAFVARAQRFVDTGDLSHLGGLRYAYVSRGPTGTRIVTFATEGQFNLLGMFPERGDAPGEDVANLARFPEMRRIISASEARDGNGLGVYTVRAPVAEVRDFYRRTMVTRGWQLLDLPRDRRLPAEVEAHRAQTQAFARNDAMLYLVFDQSEGLTSMMALASN